MRPMAQSRCRRLLKDILRVRYALADGSQHLMDYTGEGLLHAQVFVYRDRSG